VLILCNAKEDLLKGIFDVRGIEPCAHECPCTIGVDTRLILIIELEKGPLVSSLILSEECIVLCVIDWLPVHVSCGGVCRGLFSCRVACGLEGLASGWLTVAASVRFYPCFL
jgi:hypothetical protein